MKPPPPPPTIPAAVRAADRTRLRRWGLAPPPELPGPVADGAWVPPVAWLVRGRGHRKADPAELRADLPWLAGVLRAGYAGWSTAERRGWDWERCFRRWDRHLRRLPNPAPTADLFAPWREYLAFQPDGHTGPLADMGVSRGSQTLLVDGAAGAAVTAVRFRDGTTRRLEGESTAHRLRAIGIWHGGRLRPAAMLAVPAIWGGVAAVRVAGRWRPAKVVATRAGREGKPGVRRLAPDVLYAHIPTLSAANAAALRRLARRKPPARRSGDVLVVDLRGNGGGDHTAALELLMRLLPEADWRGTAPTAVRRLDSSWVRALRWGFAELHFSGRRGRLPTRARASLQPMLNALGGARGRGVRRIDETVALPAPRVAGTRQPKVLMLVDGRCGSDAELLVWILHRLPGTRVAGACTFGAAQFIHPGIGVLPRSRLAFCIATAETDLYGDGRPVDGRGLPVDIVLPDARSRAPASILALARTLWPATPPPP